MPRYAKAGSKKADIVAKMTEELQSDRMKRYVDDEDIDYNDDTDVIQNYVHHCIAYADCPANDDVQKIDFDFENSDIPDECRMGSLSDGTVYLWAFAGGDWEYPLYFAIYLDPDNRIRAYIPKDGNTYCHKCKSAWGTCECHDGKDSEDHLSAEGYGPDFAAMANDVCKRIQPK